jgi:hypothetical protein
MSCICKAATTKTATFLYYSKIKCNNIYTRLKFRMFKDYKGLKFILLNLITFTQG